VILETTDGLDATVGNKAHKTPADEFSGPLFDLSTAPNGDILIADASQGIINIYGELLASLPGVTSVDAVGQGLMWATTGAVNDATTNEGQGLYRITKNKAEMLVNLFEFEDENNPDDQEVDSNPFAVLALNGHEALVVDSGANDLLRIDNQGNVEVVAVFPNEVVSTENMKSLVGCPDSGAFPCGMGPMMPAQAVPTSVVVGPDGYYYVGELKGFPAPLNGSNIWKIAPNAVGAMCGESSDCVKAFDGGFTSIIDMVFDEDGILYVAELDARSWFAVEVTQNGVGGTIKACDPQTLECEVIASGINMLTSITFDKDGNLWATRNALAPGDAEVVMISY
jgi:hypothetical protein